MSQPPNTQHGRHASDEPVYNITDADTSRSVEQHSRMVKYTISMSVRMACFVAAFFSSGPLQWIFLAGAIFLPWVAVVIANGGSDQSRRVASTSLLDEVPRDALGAGRAAEDLDGDADPTGPDPDRATASDSPGHATPGNGSRDDGARGTGPRGDGPRGTGPDAGESAPGATTWHRRGDAGAVPFARGAGARSGDRDDAPLVLEGELVDGDAPETGPGPHPKPAAGPAAPREPGA